MIPVYKPYVNEAVLENVKEAVDSTWISSVGHWKDSAVSQLENLLHVKNVLLVNNGTAATHLVAKSVKFKRPTIENILVPNNVYVAAWNSFLYDNQFNLIPIDADEETWNVDMDKLASAIHHSDPEKTAVLIVPNLGNIVNLPLLKRSFPEHIYVEDNCEGLFGKYESRFSGTEGLVSSMSFYGNKTITSGEGGAIATNDDELYEYLNHIHGQGQTETRFVHDTLAHNYRMTNIQAAILSAQLEKIGWILERKQKIFMRYNDNLNSQAKVKVQKIDERCAHSTWMYGIRIVGNESYRAFRAHMNSRGVDIRPMFYPMSAHAHLTEYAIPEKEIVASVLAKECAVLPSYPDLQDEEIDFICECVEEYAK